MKLVKKAAHIMAHADLSKLIRYTQTIQLIILMTLQTSYTKELEFYDEPNFNLMPCETKYPTRKRRCQCRNERTATCVYVTVRLPLPERYDVGNSNNFKTHAVLDCLRLGFEFYLGHKSMSYSRNT